MKLEKILHGVCVLSMRVVMISRFKEGIRFESPRDRTGLGIFVVSLTR